MSYLRRGQRVAFGKMMGARVRGDSGIFDMHLYNPSLFFSLFFLLQDNFNSVQSSFFVCTYLSLKKKVLLG